MQVIYRRKIRTRLVERECVSFQRLNYLIFCGAKDILVFASTIITTSHANQTIILFLILHFSNIVMGFFFTDDRCVEIFIQSGIVK